MDATTRRTALPLTLLALLASGCAAGYSAPRGPDPASRPPAAWGSGGFGSEEVVEVLIENEWSTVARISILMGGTEVTLGRVEARQSKRFRIPGGASAGIVQLMARPNAVFSSAGAYRSDPIAPVAGDRMSWTLLDRPGLTGNAQENSAVRLIGCAGPCRE